MAFQIIVRDRATQDIRRQANYILAMGNRDVAERFLEFAEYALLLFLFSIVSFCSNDQY